MGTKRWQNALNIGPNPIGIPTSIMASSPLLCWCPLFLDHNSSSVHFRTTSEDRRQNINYVSIILLANNCLFPTDPKLFKFQFILWEEADLVWKVKTSVGSILNFLCIFQFRYFLKPQITKVWHSVFGCWEDENLENYLKSETCTKVPGHHIWAGSTTYFLSSPAQPYPNTCTTTPPSRPKD